MGHQEETRLFCWVGRDRTCMCGPVRTWQQARLAASLSYRLAYPPRCWVWLLSCGTSIHPDQTCLCSVCHCHHTRLLSNLPSRHGSPRHDAPTALRARVPGGIIVGRDGCGGPAPLCRSHLQGLRGGRGGDAAGRSQGGRGRGGAQEDPQEEAGLLE